MLHIFTKIMLKTFVISMFFSCSTPFVIQHDATRVSYNDGEVCGVLYPNDIVSAYLFMESVKKSGFDCNCQLTECDGKESRVIRITDSVRTIILITRK